MHKVTNQLLIKKSVFRFLKSLVIIEFFFALLPFLLILVSNLRAQYAAMPLSTSISYNLLSAMVLTTLQILVLAIAFSLWYFPTYEIQSSKIIYLRSNLFEDRKVADMADIDLIEVRQGWLARRANYGSLWLHLHNSNQIARMLDIPNPVEVAQYIEGFANQMPAVTLLSSPLQVPELISAGESQQLEFKSSLLWDYHQSKPNPELYLPVLKTLAAFMNTRGGMLLIGVDDSGSVLGLEPDLKIVKKQNIDGFEITFNGAFNKMVGVQYRQYVELSFPEIDGKQICVATARSAAHPVYLDHNGQEVFYIRAGNATQSLTISQAAQYIQSHFEE